MSKFLVLDCDSICHRAFHSMGKLSYEGAATGVLFGFLSTLRRLVDQFQTDQFIFCFDSWESKRRKAYEPYKAHRIDKYKTMDEDEKLARHELRNQIRTLRLQYLPRLGYGNIIKQIGYEGDDMIASFCMNLHDEDEAVIVSSDHDLYQLIRSNIDQWTMKADGLVTLQSFWEEWGIHPNRWVAVLAIAGCVTDNVEGIRGIGKKTAAKYVRCELNEQTATFQKIYEVIHFHHSLYYRNLLLVELPYKGTNKFRMREDYFTVERWESLCDELGLKSLRQTPPLTRMNRGA